jgi:hypothetical protein
MPYEIKEKRNKKFSVINKDTGRVLSEGTTEKKAKNQVKAIYANMKPEHRLRHRIGLIDGGSITDPIHKGIINETKKILKKEEMHGNGFWDWFNFLDPKEHPLIALVLGGTTPEMVVQAVEDYGEYAVEALIDPYSFPLAVAAAVNKKPTPPSYPNSTKPTPATPTPSQEEQEDPYTYGSDDYREYEEEEEEEEEEDIVNNKKMEPANSIEKSNYIERLDKIVSHIQDQYSAAPLYTSPLERDITGEIIGIDVPLRFPMIYNYDENNKPMYLQEFLLNNGVAGRDFAREEFGNTVLNQAPYAFIDFPINGGNIRKINYKKVGYSKY